MCSLQRNYDVIRNWERFETGPLTVFENIMENGAFLQKSSKRANAPFSIIFSKVFKT